MCYHVLVRVQGVKLNKLQREQHKGAAAELIERLEHRLTAAQPGKGRPHDRLLAERLGTCKQRLVRNPCDRDLMHISLELADLFYNSNNADKRRRPLIR